MTDNASIKIYSNKIKKRIVFKIKNGYKLELLTPETMKLLGSTKNVVDKDKNSENVTTIWAIIKHFSTHFYNDEYSKFRVFFC